jgi:hypothetical protein
MLFQYLYRQSKCVQGMAAMSFMKITLILFEDIICFFDYFISLIQLFMLLNNVDWGRKMFGLLLRVSKQCPNIRLKKKYETMRNVMG